MNLLLKSVLILLLIILEDVHTHACSIVYYKDSVSGKIYAVNNEDYWYSTKAYIEIVPGNTHQYARLWYGWDNFAQGGVNEFGLFFDGASTPQQPEIAGYHKPKGNLGDDLLSSCKTVTEALALLEQKKIALRNGHLLIGDATGNAVVVEWVEGKKNLNFIQDNVLMATNFLLSDTTKGNYPCPRYESMVQEINRIQEQKEAVDLKGIGNVVAKAVQVPATDSENREGGTLYSTFINLTDMEFILIYKLDNTKMTRLNLKEIFASGKKQKIKLE